MKLLLKTFNNRSNSPFLKNKMFGFGAVYGMAQDWPRSRRCSSHIHKEEERRQVLHRYFWKKVGSAARHPTIKTYKNNKEP